MGIFCLSSDKMVFPSYVSASLRTKKRLRFLPIEGAFS